jgi:N-ethylmaleimide reductase
MSNLFEPYKLGEITLKNRIVMAPLTRSRASAEGVHGDLAVTYYGQRATAGLIITEATAVSKQGSGYPNIPGIWNAEQVKAWQKITQAVHDKAGKIFMQMFHTGRVGHSSLFGEHPVSSTDVPPQGQVMGADYGMKDYETPRVLKTAEIADIVAQFKNGAENAKKAGFDGVEIHAANGYLLDQFLRDGVNKRSDEYGGSVENRMRILKEVVEAAVGVWGPGRVGVRLSPHNPFNSMSDNDPVATFTAIAKMLSTYKLAYLHILEPQDSVPHVAPAIRKAYSGTIVVNGGLTKETGEEVLAKNLADLICFGTPFISNPDLVERLKENLPLEPANQALFYTGGPKGYIDYPTASRKAA